VESSAERGGTASAKAEGAIAADAYAGNSKINRCGCGGRELRCGETIVQVLS
jgi:hypothetical protein